jgi:hypothetical protein
MPLCIVPLSQSFYSSGGVQLLSTSTTIPAQTQQDYAVAFINTLNPNGLSIASPLVPWPLYTPSNAQLVLETGLRNALSKDDYRVEQYQYWSQNINKFRLDY